MYFKGIEGKYIFYKEDPFPLSELDAETKLEAKDLISTRFYQIDESLDASLIEFIKRLLPLSTFTAIIEAFCCTYSKFTCGFVNHAICAALRRLLKVCP
jgi:gamma-tubulin complex component 2